MAAMTPFFNTGMASIVLAALYAAGTVSSPAAQELIRVDKARRCFVRGKSSEVFTPWGFNYDHDRSNRLLEYYWNAEWDSVGGDFEEMKALGANTVRVHLQVSRFMVSTKQANQESLDQLARLLRLAQKAGLYLDITGLGCYDKPDVPRWYNALGENERWDVQARFWQAIARTCRRSPAVFCYDLMNEPIIGGSGNADDWTPGAFGDRYFVQRLTLDAKGRTSQQVAEEWVNKMVAAIRKHDRVHLVTVGAIPWALTWPNAKPIFYSKEASENLDFVSLHVYPESGKVDKALQALGVYDIGKPMVIEEMFPMTCSVKELDQFIDGSRPRVCGWIGFYWGKTITEYKQDKRTIADDLTLHWLEYFARKTPEILKEPLAPTR